MQTKTHFRTAITAILFLGLLPFSGFSQDNPPDPSFGPPPGRGMGMFRQMKEKLKITADQEKQLKAMHQKYMRDRIQFRADLQVRRLDARQIAESDNPERGPLEKKLREISEIQTRQKLSMFDEMTEAQKILTPEQLKEWKEMRGDMRHGMMERMRHRRGAGR